MRSKGLDRARLVVVSLVALGVAVSEASAAAPGEAKEGAAVVRVVKTGDGYRLTRDGVPYVIKGAGGDGPIEALAAAGGNSIRTWGVDAKTGATLDRAHRLGLTVTVGIWLGHERQGFNYGDPAQVAGQFEEAKRAVLRYKDHPALLMWGVGNEMEMDSQGKNPAVWAAVNEIAGMAKRLDPNHPTLTAVAEIGGDKVKTIHRLCPEVDVVGINSYGGAASSPSRYKAAGGTKPFVLTEYGPPGQWEAAKTSWGAPRELTSTAKAEAYRTVYRRAVAPGGLCLGSYAFIWGSKHEGTATWHGLFLEDGSRTAGVDALTELWSGRPPADRCPTVEAIKLSGPDKVDPGAVVRVALSAGDPEGTPLTARWLLAREGGAAPTFADAVVKADATGAEVRMPRDGGGYRLYAFVHDARGNAATANVPLFVEGPPVAAGKTPKLPLTVYDEAGAARPPYSPSGYMGNVKAIALREDCPDDPHSGTTCLRADYRAGDGWGGVVWQDPANDWGDAPGGFDLTGARRLSFWARGDRGGESVAFSFGVLGRDKAFFDTASGKTGDLVLTPRWRRYTIDLAGKDLTRIKTGFCFSLAGDGRPVTFFLDDIRYE